jgi:predicted small secreted protein
MKNTILPSGVFLIICLLLAGCANSNDPSGQDNGVQQGQPQDQGPQDNGNVRGSGRGMGGPRGGMGAQFIDACSGKAAGDACTLNLRNQSVEGTCSDRNGNISCAPNNASLMQGPGIPGGRNEAFIQACSGKGAGDLCTVTMRNQTLDGTCADRSGNISCVPNNTGQRQGGRGNPGV